MGMSNMPIGGGRQDYSRILVIVTNGMRHPLFVSFFGRETRSSGEAENDWKEHKAVQGSRNDERNPHPEVVDLQAASERATRSTRERAHHGLDRS